MGIVYASVWALNMSLGTGTYGPTGSHGVIHGRQWSFVPHATHLPPELSARHSSAYRRRVVIDGNFEQEHERI